MKIKLKTEIFKVRRAGTLGSDFIDVTHYLFDHDKEIPIFTFHLENLHSDKAKKLGNELTRIITPRLRIRKFYWEIDVVIPQTVEPMPSFFMEGYI